MPSDMAHHLSNTHATIDFVPVKEQPELLTLDNLGILNRVVIHGEEIYLASNENIIDLPKWIKGIKPSPKTLQTKNAFSSVIIVTDKGNGVIDAFYMYFYSFNEGPTALGHRAGNHLGDWYVPSSFLTTFSD